MSVSEFFESCREGWNLVGDHITVFELLRQDRDAACQAISNLVGSQPPEMLDRFEKILLQQSIVIIDPDSRRRVMELYAWLKLAETAKYGRFRGFLPEA